MGILPMIFYRNRDIQNQSLLDPDLSCSFKRVGQGACKRLPTE